MSSNVNRRTLDDAAMARVLAAAGIDPRSMAAFEELGAATYNTAYRIRLDDGTGLVLKVAPDPTAPGLSHERDLMRTEAMFYDTASGALPVPRVVRVDFSRDAADSDWLLMTELPGRNWHEQEGELSDGERRKLRRELGELTARLHRISGDAFGYPQLGLSGSWRAAFQGMLGVLLDDAGRWDTPLPVPVSRIRALFDANAGALDEVTTPVLVHFDLWPGNVLLHEGRITGIVDGERALWGDPLAEMVSLALFGSIEDDDEFLSGYGGITFDDDARRRLAMYRAYLYLIMLTEGAPRGYAGPQREAALTHITRHLDTALADLEALAAP
ncbi:phosphotransferase family protein [Myceligenerans pegani]|uniref:Aminoglycoside phosphotransferase family protein n=1 Tax=Myceligenerans pegani TaxID=2776917 RepID=A0ABR9MZB2_9MICO|nr:aminoglycoside phosphotransferase family protein [Myceligenerans sp. TRM 65318]MBE1876732.1 aminoglycoside phosphotransferase family protein [Myceligenerans sp. TRM 65318]MBE3019003.1 aminoglycoside phosphotransferase family protein [Myceligenerans sp. TRM 65318]